MDDRSPQLRVDGRTWNRVREAVFRLDREGAGFLLVRRLPHSADLVVEAFLPVPNRYIVQGSAHPLEWSAALNLNVADRARESGLGLVLLHAHPHQDPPRPSPTDRKTSEALLRFFQREVPDQCHGAIVLGGRSGVAGDLVRPDGHRFPARIAASSNPPEFLPPLQSEDEVFAEDRQYLAFGAAGFRALGQATVAVVGLSGGGSHVAQQLVHAGVGALVPIDPQIVEETNLRRLVGARAVDVGKTPKVAIPVRMAREVRPSVTVRPLQETFPSAKSLRALASSDVIVGCVDDWLTREGLNRFALRHRIPYIDIGASIFPGTDTAEVAVYGQVAIVLPGGPCLRCMVLLTDARVEDARNRKQGYGDDLHEPQVVSINGTLASEAVTATLLLLAGQTVRELHRRYEIPPGTLEPVIAHRRPRCPACREAGL